MRILRTVILSVALTFALPSAPAMAGVGNGWGASWSFGPVRPTTSNSIIYAKTTMVPGRLPASYWSSTNVGPLFLWPGLSNPTSDLIQTTMDSWSGTENSSYCSGNGSQWCVEASVFGSFGQKNGPTVAIDADDQVTIEYALGTDNETWTQTVTSQKLGKVVSTLQTAAGEMLGSGFGFATEADAYSFTVDTCYYLCTEILLAAADPDFGATGVGANGGQQGANGTGSGPATAKNLHTPDNGLTWLVDVITIPAMNPQGPQTPTPAYSCSSSAVDAARMAPEVQENWVTPGQEVPPARVAREVLWARAVRVGRPVTAEPLAQITGVRPDADAGPRAIPPAEGLPGALRSRRFRRRRRTSA
jgi:hypothetical protein